MEKCKFGNAFSYVEEIGVYKDRSEHPDLIDDTIPDENNDVVTATGNHSNYTRRKIKTGFEERPVLNC